MLTISAHRIPAIAATTVLLAISPLSIAQVKPALVRDVSTATPVNAYCSQSDFSTPGYAKCILYVVPAGKRLVVEVLSYQIYLDAAYQASQIVFGLDSCPSCSNMLFSNSVRVIGPTAVFNPSYRFYGASENTRLYLEENATFSVQANFQSGGAHYVQGFNFTGYLVDK